MPGLCNHLFDEIAVGQSASVAHTVSAADIEMLALVGGDVAPFASELPPQPVSEPHAQGATAIVLIASLLNRRLPGPGTTILESAVHYAGTIIPGDVLNATVEVAAKDANRGVVDLSCRCVNQRDEVLLHGTMRVAAPRDRQFDSEASTQAILRRSDDFAKLFARCAGLPPIVCGVVHPCDRESLLGALEAARAHLIVPVLIGPQEKIRATAASAGVDLAPYRIVSTEHSHAAAAKGVQMARRGEVGALMKGSLHTDELMAEVVATDTGLLMKGSLHTDELMAEVVATDTGLRTARRISHVYVIDVPTYPRPLLVTDAAINVFPNLEEKADIARNAIDLAHALGIECPRLAILSAVETINPKLESTIHAAALCKMADRGQITGALVDGPLAFDNAVSERAAQAKGIVSRVAGKADILLVPDLEAGNMIAKQLQYLAGADAAGIVLGARVPIVLTSRADTARSRLASAAVMQILAHASAGAPSSLKA